MKDLEKIFLKGGGEFLSPPSVLKGKAEKIKAIIFDWDGVFNNGEKDSNNSSSYAEGDAMGTNLLRFAYYLTNGKVPVTSIFTGAQNDLAIRLANREHFNLLVFRCLDKGKFFQEFLSKYDLNPEEVAFCFDDVLDLPIAKQCGLRFYIKSGGRYLFEDYLKEHNLYDYKTGNYGGQNAIREVCELVMGLLGKYDIIIEHRLSFSEMYKTYLAERNANDTEIMEWKG